MDGLGVRHYYSCCHAMLNKNGARLIFTSARRSTDLRTSSPSPLLFAASPSEPTSSNLKTLSATAADEPGPSTQYIESSNVEESVVVLKRAAKTRKVPATEVAEALRIVENAKLDPSSFLATIAGSPETPGPRTWMLIFTSSKDEVVRSSKGEPAGGSYIPITAVQKFDAMAMTIENGVYFGPLGCLTFQGRMSWKNRILAFLFDSINIKIGSLGPFKFNIGKKEDEGRTPSTKDPFFIWFYADEEIIVAKGRGGGVALWCRCARVSS